MLDQTLTIVLAGGNGTRLKPLTADRAKPAVPFGGKYRIIDFTLSNCLRSGLRRVLVLTQYKSHSLTKHLRDGWSIYNPELGEYITPVPPQMRAGESWYTGTANAIYQNRYLLERSGAEWTLILAGDHIYRMDYAAMLKHHRDSGADATVACMDVPIADAAAFGVLQLDENQRILQFQEKPEKPAPDPGNPSRALVSMGIYVFPTATLLEVLEQDHNQPESDHDFGRDVFPALVERVRIQAYRFGGAAGRVSSDRYWRDVGTLDGYYQANMDLLEPVPPLDLYQSDWSIRTYQSQHPPARTVPGQSGTEGISINSIIGSGVIIAGGSVQHSVLFPDVFVGDETFVQDSILFADAHVGANCQLSRCIVDKGVEIPPNTQIGLNREADRARFNLSEGGIVVVPKGYRFT
ncbi:MAG: glucose-1-phosphate adenylyltransferase [Chromatiales bacterium]|nr:glucose-1-phosphate adenylyltransferase [Chromatiales bacterium]